MNQICNTCRESLPLSRFGTQGTRADGSTRYRTCRKACRRATEKRKRKTMREHRKDLQLSAYRREYEVMRSLRFGPRPSRLIEQETGIPNTTLYRILGELRDDGIVAWDRMKGWFLNDEVAA